MKIGILIMSAIFAALSGCASHYWEGRAYEEKIKALTFNAEGKPIKNCTGAYTGTECVIR